MNNKKSGLSMTSLIGGIISTSLGVIMFPLAAITKTPEGMSLLGFLGITVMLAGFIGIVASSAKLMTTDKNDISVADDRKIAWKGFWFSASPIAIWIFLMMVGAMAR